MKKMYAYVFAALMGLFCASMLVTYILVDSKKVPLDAEKLPISEEVEVTVKGETASDLNDFLYMVDDISIEPRNNQDLDINKKDVGVLYAKLRLIKKIKLPDNDDSYVKLKSMVPEYTIHNNEIEYSLGIYTEGYIEAYNESNRVIYSTVEIEDIINVLDNIVIDNIVYKTFAMKDSAIRLDIGDDGSYQKLSKTQLRDIGQELEVTAIEKNIDTMIVPEYPNYKIEVMNDINKVSIQVINSNMIRITSTDYDFVVSTNNKLWKYLDIRYPVTNIIAEADIRYILKNSGVDVYDIYNDYDISTDGGYGLVLARHIVQFDGDIIIDKDVLKNEFLQYTISFKVNNKTKDVNIYQNYYTYNDVIYEYNGVSDIIKTLIIMP